MTADQYWASEGVRMLNHDRTIPSVEQRVKAAFEAGQESRPFGCKCQTFGEKILGDGCEECNKALVIEMLKDELAELRSEIEKLEAISK